MGVFLKVIAGTLLAVVVSLILSRQSKDFSVILIICVCCMVSSVAVGFYKQIFQFIEKLEQSGNLNTELIQIILKSVGIALISEITILICADSGNSALGKVIQMMSSALIIWICIPLFTKLLEMVESILGYL